jgi:pyruvate/2-oxoglutarate dehydrogenase complex dihydrolipoamide dehydrogenase (E3) component
MAHNNTFDYDLIVIGSGAGGSAAATIAARAGKRVAIIEADTFGGDSPNWSDVPTKALLHAAQLYDEDSDCARRPLATTTRRFAPGKTSPYNDRVPVVTDATTKIRALALLAVPPTSFHLTKLALTDVTYRLVSF